ncbi:MAG TPA: CRTAC1 family protein [Pirellulaceae bacterium]|nr:CRTAC1 family protein [Pirellulaceae bacterium]
MNCPSLLGTTVGTMLLLFTACGCTPGSSKPVPVNVAANGSQKPVVSPSPTSDNSEEDEGLTQSQTPLRFTLMNDAAGVHHVYRNASEAKKRRILESVGGGGGMFDYDADGRLDLAFAGGGYYGPQKTLPGHPSTLFRNLGDWKFVDVSAGAGGGFPARCYSHGTHAADYDNDGFVDFVVCGYSGLQLWHNLGDGTFEEVHDAAGLHDRLWSTCAGWGDLNGDGFLDLYVVHYGDWSLDNDPFCPGPVPSERETCPPREFASLPDTLYYSNGDGTFRDVSREAGLNLDPMTPEGTPRELGKGLGVLINDFDLDGDQDIYVANDTVNNFLYLNQGDGTFIEDGLVRGVATDDAGMPNGSMGADVADFNRDGLPDLWVTNYQYETNGLYRNEGEGQFAHVSRRLGITAIGGLYVGFGTVFADLNRDGYEDLVIANGHVQFFPVQSPFLQEPIIFLNDKGRIFRRLRMNDDPYFGKGHAGRGLMAGDLDNDGDTDFCFVNNNDPCGLIRNDSVDDGQWLSVRLVGTTSNRDGIGAVLRLQTTDGEMMRMVKGSSSFASQCDLRPLWGVPAGCQIQGLSITWPSGIVQSVAVTKGGQELTILEPKEPRAD